MSNRWEYMVLDSRVTNYFHPELDGDALTRRLNELGEQGWEAVSMSPMAMMRGRTKDMVILLKRTHG